MHLEFFFKCYVGQLTVLRKFEKNSKRIYGIIVVVFIIIIYYFGCLCLCVYEYITCK